MERPFSETVQEAPLIVRGVVGMSYADWGKDSLAARRIFTFYELRVEDVVKGQLQERNVIMRELGGLKDGLGMEVAGAARFARGDDVVVMLEPKAVDGAYPVQGMMMGKYDIRRDADGKEYLDGAGIAGEHPALRAHTQSEKRWTLDSLKELVAQQARAPRSPTAAAPSAATDGPSAAAGADRAISPSPTSASSPAPALQNPASQERPAPSDGEPERQATGRWLSRTLGIGLGIAIFAYARLRKRKPRDR